MITTNVGGCGNFYLTADDPAGPWSDPFVIDNDTFDPSLLFDDDGMAYYTRRGNGGIVQATIDIKTGRLTSDLRTICGGFVSHDIEGPHLYKINGMYYLMAAECGTRFGHSETIGRSRSPWGPFESCPLNPILTHRHRSHGPIRDVGHAELFEDHRGNWWVVCLGTRQFRYDNASILGRETFLAPVTWTADGWPAVGNEGAIEPQLSIPGVLQDNLFATEHDDFSNDRLGPSWEFLRNPYDADWSLSERKGWLRIRGSAVTLNDCDSPAFVCRRQQHLEAEASCLLDFEPGSDNEEAGLTVYANERFHYDLIVTRRNGRRSIIARKQIDDMICEMGVVPIGQGPAKLIVNAKTERYHFSCEDQAGNRHELAAGLSRLLSPEIAGNGFGSWTGVMLGMFASGNGKSCRNPADFDWFDYHGS
jgi:alpha-N-arabinofuranosidase